VVTPIAAQIFDPQATSTIGEGTYFSFTVVIDFDATVANQGDESFSPPTTHRSSDVQANERMELDNDETLDHEVPKLWVRTIFHPVESLAKPRHVRPAHFSDVSAAHVRVEGLASVSHGVSPSSDAATSIPLDEFTKLAMHRLAFLHESDDAASSVGTPMRSGADHDTPPSMVTRTLEPAFDESRMVQDIDA
jgi:hypothetical protein